MKNVFELSKYADRVKPLGRYQILNDGIGCDHSATGIELCASIVGSLELSLLTTSEKEGCDAVYFTVYIDGARQEGRLEALVGEQTVTIAEFSELGSHTIKIVKQTEFKWSLATVKSLEITGTLSKAPKEKDIYVEFLGDSLTAAYGNIGKAGVSNGDSPNYEDGTQSYAYIFANSIDADYTILARSAGGINQCWSNSPIIDYYNKFSKDRSSEAFDFENARKPDLIVIHLGANDYNVAREEGGISSSEKKAFVEGGKKLIKLFRENYGTDIPIIWAYDPNEGFPTEVKEIINSFGGESAGYYTISLPYTDKGADAHPTVKEHEKHAKQLLDLVVDKNIIK